jgi:hypothetical protein
MADKVENILVEFDYNNITIVDPNKVVDLDGNVKERYVKQENLVMYANLECRVLPRTKLAVGSANDDAIQTVSLASINFLNPGGKRLLDNAYTNEITGQGSLDGKGVNQPKQNKITNPNKSNDWYIRQTTNSNGKVGATDNGLLGMTSININQDLSFMPRVDIQLEDVKGRALFEAGDNSPYAAFFNLPYPLFHLTIKGYYGKAVKLALMLQSFSSRYDSGDGNFKITLNFYTYKYTILNEISMGYLVAAPHMYKSRLKVQTQEGGPSKFSNVDNEIVEKGYQKVKEMYNEYKSKGLVPDDFPELTIVQMRDNIENFVKNTLDSFTKENLTPLDNLDKYQTTLNDFEKDVFLYLSGGKGSWFDKYMDRTNFLILKDGTKVYTYKKEFSTPQSRTNIKTELFGDKLIKYNKELNENLTVGLNGRYTIGGKEKACTVKNNINENTFKATNVVPDQVDFGKIYKQYKKVNNEPTVEDKENLRNELIRAGIFDKSDDKIFGFKIISTEWFKFEGPNTFMDLTGKMSKDLKVIRGEIETALTEALSNLLVSKDNGIGFTPTIRNVLAVIFANGEAFLRLLDEVHTKAWDVRDDKIRKDAIFDKEVSNASADTKDVNVNANIPVYPWPQYIVATSGEDGHEKYEIQYPGDSKLVSKTKGFLFDVWPEIEFVEEFIKGFVERTTPPADPTDGNNELTETQRITLNAVEYPASNEIFGNKEEVKFIYELYERLAIYTYYTKLSRVYGTSEIDVMAKVIADVESNNVLKSLSNSNPFLIQKIKNYALNSQNIIPVLKHISNNGIGQNWQNYIRGIFNTVYLKYDITDSPFEIMEITSGNDITISLSTEKEITDYISASTKSNVSTFTDLYPFTSLTWENSKMGNGDKINNTSLAFNTTKVLNFSPTKKLITNYNSDDNAINVKRPFSNFLGTNISVGGPRIKYGLLKEFYDYRKPNRQFLTEGNLKYNNYSGNVTSDQTVSMLNTPYFVNAIQNGVENFRNSDLYPYKSAAYLFINSLPLATLREKYKTNDGNGATTDLDYIFATMKKFGAIHRVPYAWILKYGSIWHRYKSYVETGTDMLETSWSGFSYIKNYDPVTNNPTKDYALTINGGNYDIILEKNTSITNSVSSLVNVGFYPKTINDFNVFYQGFMLYSGYTSSDIQNGITSGLTLNYVDSAIINKSNNLLNSTVAAPRDLTVIPWTVHVKTLDDKSFFLMPSEGSILNQTENECFKPDGSQSIEITGNTAVYDGSVRSFWAAPNYGYFDINKLVKPSPSQYLKEIFSGQSGQENFSINGKSGQYSEIEEMFSVFEKDVLDIFETEFLNYSKSIYDSLDGDYLRNFQGIMRNLAKIPKTSADTTNELVLKMQDEQVKNFNLYITNFLNYNKLIKYGNPSSYDKKLFYTFSNLSIIDPYTFGNYTIQTPNALPPNTTLATSITTYPDEWKALKTYVGFSTIDKLVYDNNGSYITDFFIDNNVSFDVLNIKNLAPLIKIYATAKLNDNTFNNIKFLTSMTQYIREVDSFQDKVFNNIMITLNKKLPNVNNSPENQIASDLEGPQTKIELWEAFKSLNDKWISGNDFKVKTLFEDVLLLDRASRNIGDKVLVDVYKLKNRLQNILDSPKVSMLVFIQTILQENNFVVHNLPSYVNFYNVQDVSKNPKPKPEGTLEFANTLFGTFMNVDYRESGPKMVCYYAGKPSEQLDLKENVDYRYRNDAFDLRRVDNPLVENQVGKKDWDKSNKVVGFNVDIGPQNQSMFYGFMVDQKNSSSTVESLEVLNQTANQYGNRGGSTQSLSLYNLYKNRSYTCTVSMMGNALIQPTMYFNLRYVPMFNGPYMIQTVSHSITQGSFETIITGIRQPTASLPKIDGYIQTLRTNLLKSVIENNKKDRAAKEIATKNADGTAKSQQEKIQAISGGDKELTQPQSCKPSPPYDTYHDITPTINNSTFGQVKYNLKNVILSDNINGSVLQYVVFAALYVESANGDLKMTAYENNYGGVTLSGGKWGASSKFFDNNKQFYCQTSANDSTTLPYAVFNDLYNHLKFVVGRFKDRMSGVEATASSIAKFLIINNLTINGPTMKSINVYDSYDKTKLKNLENKIQKSIDVFNATN